MKLTRVLNCSIERRFLLSLSLGAGKVCSIYDNSVNICCSKPFGNIVVLNPTSDRAPASLTLSHPVSFDDCNISVGSPVTLKNNLLTMGTLVVDISRAEYACCDASPVETLAESVASSHERLNVFLGQQQARFRAVFTRYMSDALAEGAQRLETSLISGDKIDDAVAGLVGLGVGLTPSGDDYLVGALATLTILRGPGDWRVVALSEALKIRAEKTTEVSRWMLLYGVDGSFRQSLIELVSSCGTSGHIKKPLEALLKVGASSGFDMSTGVASGLHIYRVIEGGRQWLNTHAYEKMRTMIL